MRQSMRVIAFVALLSFSLEARGSSHIFETAFDSPDDSIANLEASGLWSFYTSRPSESRIEVGAIGGHDSALILGEKEMDNDHDDKTLNEAILTLDLSGYTNIDIHFEEYDSDDHPNKLPDVFDGHQKDDGLAISSGDINDDTEWYTVWTVEDDGHGHDHPIQWTEQWFSLESFIVDNMLDRSNIHLKFQQYDNKEFPHDGRAFDNILVEGQMQGGGGPVIPEPSTLSLLGLGAIGLAGYRTRRKRKQPAQQPGA